jgi:hypothetical protein
MKWWWQKKKEPPPLPPEVIEEARRAEKAQEEAEIKQREVLDQQPRVWRTIHRTEANAEWNHITADIERSFGGQWRHS